MSDKFEMVAKTFQGLENVLADELKALGAEDVEPGRRVVAFKGDKATMYRANFCCRTALRILKPIYKFHASNVDELYEEVKKYNWDKVLSVKRTFSIDSTVYSEDFRHSKFVTYRVKDAIADYFSEKYGERPSIRLSKPDVSLMFTFRAMRLPCRLTVRENRFTSAVTVWRRPKLLSMRCLLLVSLS